LFVTLDVSLEPPLNEAFHEIEGDPGKVLLKNMMEDVAWVHESSRWICKLDAYIDCYTIKWLCCQNLTKHMVFAWRWANLGIFLVVLRIYECSYVEQPPSKANT
jgi:hypothetical protein